MNWEMLSAIGHVVPHPISRSSLSDLWLPTSDR